MKHFEHQAYLLRVSTHCDGEPPLITPETADKAWSLWQKVRQATSNAMPAPSAGTGPDGQMFYSWDSQEHHLEAEIRSGLATELFYRNRMTGEAWLEEHFSDDALPEDLLPKLKLFIG